MKYVDLFSTYTILIDKVLERNHYIPTLKGKIQKYKKF